MSLLSQSKQVLLTILNNNGFYTKSVQIENLIPTTFGDFLHMDQRKHFEIPEIIDDEMVYVNQQSKEFYLFDSQGIWNEENLKDPVLAVSTNFNERKWIDQVRGM